MLQHTWLLLTPTQTHWGFHSCTLHDLETWLFRVTRVTSAELTKMMADRSHSWFETNQRKIKEMTHCCAQGEATAIVCSALKVWCKQSWFENTDYHTDYSVLSLSSTIFLNYAITIKTLSPRNQTSTTKEPTGLSTGDCGRGWVQTDGTSGRDRWSPTEVICSLWN